MTWQLRGRSQPRCGSGRMAAVWLRAPALCFLFTFLTCALQTGSQIDNRDNKIFWRFWNLQPKIYGDTIVMVVGYCQLDIHELAMIHFHLWKSHWDMKTWRFHTVWFLSFFQFPSERLNRCHCQQQLQWIGYEIWTIILTHHQMKLLLTAYFMHHRAGT